MRVEAVQKLTEGTGKIVQSPGQDMPVPKSTDTPVSSNTGSQLRLLKVSSQLQQIQAQDNDKDSRKSNEDKKPSEKDIMRAADFLNKLAKVFDFKLQFRVHKETQRIFTKIVDPETDKVLREVPPEKMLDMVARMEEMMDDLEGVLLDRYV